MHRPACAPTWQALRAHVPAHPDSHTHSGARSRVRAWARRRSGCRLWEARMQVPCWAGGGWSLEAPHPGWRREGTSPSLTFLPLFNHPWWRRSRWRAGAPRPLRVEAPTDPAALKPETRPGTAPAFCQGQPCPAPFGEGFLFSGLGSAQKGGGLVPLSGGSDTVPRVDR